MHDSAEGCKVELALTIDDFRKVDAYISWLENELQNRDVSIDGDGNTAFWDADPVLERLRRACRMKKKARGK